MTLAMIGRCDSGGLGAISVEMFRHLNPDRTLLLNLGDFGRALCNPSAFDVHHSTGQQVYPADWNGGLSDRAVEWLCADPNATLLSFETFYDDKVLTTASRSGMRSVCYAMPELAPWATTALHPPPRSAPRPELYIPTSWRADTVPGARILPMPVARDRLPFRERNKVEHLYHVAGAAMLDRNGTGILLAALQFVESPIMLTIRAEKPIEIPPCNAAVEVVTEPTLNYWDAVPDDVDLLVLPRRYGGLCLPVQECASRGIPSVMLQPDPYSPFGFVHGIPTTRSHDVQMKGGRAPVYDADPRVLAKAIDWLYDHPDRQNAASWAADAWAEQHRWDGPLGKEWCELMNADCAS